MTTEEGIHHHPHNSTDWSLEPMDENKLSDNNMYLNQPQKRVIISSSFVKRQIIKTSESSKRSTRSWWKNPKIKRRRRVAKYRFYTVEGKVKSSIKKGIKWLKTKCSRIIFGF
ncbi:hypothetical protein SDJN02_05448, partial [Cucurbita argyrosperma subsp. argyrosperma]